MKQLNKPNRKEKRFLEILIKTIKDLEKNLDLLQYKYACDWWLLSLWREGIIKSLKEEEKFIEAVERRIRKKFGNGLLILGGQVLP